MMRHVRALSNRCCDASRSGERWLPACPPGGCAR